MAETRLLDQVRSALASRHYSPKTADAYVAWTRRFVLFHGKRHPVDLGPEDAAVFLSDLATRQCVSASTQNQALAARLFLYSKVLGKDLGSVRDIVPAKRPARLPVVMAPIALTPPPAS